MVFLPVYSSQIVVLKGVKTAAGIPLIHKQRSAARRQWFRCLYQTVMSKIAPMTRRTRSLKHFVLFRVRPVFGLFRCLWSVLQSYIINHTRVRLDSWKGGSRSVCMVCTKVQVEPNLPSMNTSLLVLSLLLPVFTDITCHAWVWIIVTNSYQ